jgi:hypothetical protein
MANINPDDSEKYENFDALYAHELEVQRELEKVEVAYVKTVERYGEYSILKSFVEYLKGMEKFFMENKLRNHSFEISKDEMIKNRIKMLASTCGVGEEVLNAIHRYFKKAGQNVDKIYEIARELTERYKNEPDCQDFILYVQDILVNFLNAEREHLSMDDLQDRLVRARMEVLSSKGDPDLLTLEKIYKEFKGLLSTN